MRSSGKQKRLDFELDSYSFKNSKDLPKRLDLYLRGKPFRDQPKINGDKPQNDDVEDSKPAANSPQ